MCLNFKILSSPHQLPHFLFPSTCLSVCSPDSLPSPYMSVTSSVQSTLATTLFHYVLADHFLGASPSLPKVAHHSDFQDKYVNAMLVAAKRTFFTVLQTFYS